MEHRLTPQSLDRGLKSFKIFDLIQNRPVENLPEPDTHKFNLMYDSKVPIYGFHKKKLIHIKLAQQTQRTSSFLQFRKKLKNCDINETEQLSVRSCISMRINCSCNNSPVQHFPKH